MKIAHVTDFYLPRLGGIEMHVHDLAARQRLAGHSVDIITSSPPEPGHPVDPHVRRVGSGLRWQNALNPFAAPRVHALLRSSDYDVVHGHSGVWSSAAFAGALSGGASGIPSVITWHSLLNWATPLYRFGDFCVDYTARPVYWTAVSACATQALKQLVPPGTEVGVLPNAVDVEDWQVDPMPRDPADVHVVSVMRLAPRKRPIQLLKVLRAVRRDLPEGVRLRTTIIGEGPERATMERYVARHDLGRIVSICGRLTRQEIREVYRRADVFVAPAKLESFGIAALEARCAGLPVVAMQASGIADFVTDGVDGLLVGSDAQMVSALVRLAGDTRLRASIAAHNRAVAPAYGWADALAGTEKAYAHAAQIAGTRRTDTTFLRAVRPGSRRA